MTWMAYETLVEDVEFDSHENALSNISKDPLEE